MIPWWAIQDFNDKIDRHNQTWFDKVTRCDIPEWAVVEFLARRSTGGGARDDDGYEDWVVCTPPASDDESP
jgi:hypothetical protein